ncbi:MAG: hypothetical protein R3B71_06030 [Candidatus Gracilibacteria bacterium]
MAQPASNPPGGNVDAQFDDTVTVGPGAFSVDSDGTVTNPGGTNSGMFLLMMDSLLNPVLDTV